MGDRLGKKIIVKFVVLRAEAYSYLINNGSEDRKSLKLKLKLRKIKFENYKICLEATQIDNKIKYLEKMKLTQIVSFGTKENIKNS